MFNYKYYPAIFLLLLVAWKPLCTESAIHAQSNPTVDGTTLKATEPEMTSETPDTSDSVPDSAAATDRSLLTRMAPWIAAVGVLFLGGILTWFVRLFIREIERGRPIQIETHWGGLGGGFGGWRISPSLTYFLAALLFGLLLAMVITSMVNTAYPQGDQESRKAEKVSSFAE